MKSLGTHLALRSLDDLLGTRPAGGVAASPSMPDFLEQIGERLRWQRLAFEWRQSDVAERAGVSVQTVKSVEKGDIVSGESFFRLLMAFGHGQDLLAMLESPHFPTLDAHQRYVTLSHLAAPAVKRVRPKSRTDDR